MTLPANEAYVFERLYIVLPEMVCAVVVLVWEIPITEAVLDELLLALAMARSLIVLFEIVFVPLVVVIPLISPVVPVAELVVPLVSFETVFPEMVTAPVEAL